MKALFFFAALVALAFVSAEAFTLNDTRQITVTANGCGPGGCDKVAAQISCAEGFLAGDITATGQGTEMPAKTLNEQAAACGCDKEAFARFANVLQKAAKGETGKEQFSAYNIEYASSAKGTYVVTMSYKQP